MSEGSELVGCLAGLVSSCFVIVVDSDFSLDPQDGLEAETDLDCTRYYE